MIARTLRPRLAATLTAFVLTAAASADPYMVFLEGSVELDGVRAASNEVVAMLRDAHAKAFRAIAPALRPLGLAEREITHLWIGNAVALDLDPVEARQLSELPGVERVERETWIPLPRTVDHGEALPLAAGDVAWSVERVKAPQAWSRGLDGQGVTVGVIDTGADGTHPDLQGKILRFRDFVGDSHSPVDGQGHGTHVAGTIVGGAAGSRAIGVAPKAKLVVARALGESGGGSIGLMRAMQWMMDPDGNDATDDAPDICSNSWGSWMGINPIFWPSVKAMRSAGIVPVFAAGNDGPDAKSVGIPGGYPEAFAVGATDDDDAIADFSSRGPRRWFFKVYTKPDVSAPGDFVYSSRDGGGYTYMSGTSMATPAVSGVLALVKQRYPWMGVDQLVDRVMNTARDMGPAGKDNDFGAGITDAQAATGGS